MQETDNFAGKIRGENVDVVVADKKRHKRGHCTAMEKICNAWNNICGMCNIFCYDMQL